MVDPAIDEGGRVNTTKTRRHRSRPVDADTTAMLLEHCEAMNQPAASMRVEVVTDPFVFSLAIDCST